MGGIGRFQKKASVANALGTDSVDSLNFPALMDGKALNSNSTLLNSGEFESLELPSPTLKIHYDSNFRARIVGEQSSPDTRLSAIHFGMFDRLCNSFEGSLQNELLNEKQASGFVEELEGNLYATINGELRLPTVWIEYDSLAAVGSKIEQCAGNFNPSLQGYAACISVGKSAVQRKEQEEIRPEYESTTPVMRQATKNDTALENSEEIVNKCAKTRTNNSTIESLIDGTEHAYNSGDPKEELCVCKQSTDVLNVTDINKQVDPEDAAHEITGSSITAHRKDALCVPDDFPIIPDQQSLVDEIDAESSEQKQADQSQKLNCELTSLDSQGSFSQPDVSNLPSGGLMSSEIMYLSKSKHCKGLAAKNLQTSQNSSLEFGHSNLSMYSEQTTQAAPANMVSASSSYSAVPSSMEKEKMRESLAKKTSSYIQPLLLLKSSIGPNRPVLTSSASKDAHISFKNEAPMESTPKLSRPIMETNRNDLINKSNKADGLPALCHTSHRQDIDVVPSTAEISPRLIITSSSKSLKDGVEFSSNTLAVTDSNSSLPSPHVLTASLQHSEDVGKPVHNEVSKLVPVAATGSTIVSTNYIKHDEYNQAELSPKGSESFDCLLTKFLMSIRDVQDSLDVSSTDMLDAEITYAEIYNEALDMQGQMIDSVEEIDAAMRCAEKSIESTKEWV